MQRIDDELDQNEYESIQAFSHFVGDAFNPKHYVEVPSSWYVLVADIESSTQAVDRGRYEDVNFVGAACVAALNNALDGTAVPTVFGGDGASAAVPPRLLAAAIESFRATRRWALDSFGLRLRVGAIAVHELKARGANLDMGKMQLGPGNEVAMFRGRGLDFADEIIKADDSFQYRIPDETPDATIDSAPDLSNLSCRWSPIDSERGVMLCLIVGVDTIGSRTQQQVDATYSKMVNQIDAIVRLEDPATNPAKVAKLRFKIRARSISKEIKTRSGSLVTRFVSVLSFSLFSKILFKFNLRAGSFDPNKYIHEVTLNSDFIKMSGMIRAVIDCSAQQANAIETLLEANYQTGEVVYGLHRADQALMTCITPDVSNGRHLHYIDATNGGLWRAASDLKRRIGEGNAVSDA